jgi:hypothetical protein
MTRSPNDVVPSVLHHFRRHTMSSVSGDSVGSKKTPSACPGTVPGYTDYPVTTQPGEKGSIIVNVNTSHSIEKYPEDNTSD